MTTVKKQGIIMIAGLITIVLLGVFGHSPQPNPSPADEQVIAKQDRSNATCDGATQWTPHGPYVGPVN